MIKRSFAFIFLIFLLPALVSTGLWYAADRPQNWRMADWGSSGLLPDPTPASGPAVYVLAARTGGLKGALAVHSWIVIKREGASDYDGYEKVGWGNPVRKNARVADGRWYSNEPFIVATVTGDRARALIPKVQAAIESYPWNKPGGYRIWPGPNSNSFVAHVLHQVPEIGAVLPPNAVGRDYLAGSGLSVDSDGRDVHLSLFGLAGIAVGARSGFELQFLGLVAGVDFARPALKVPGFGLVGPI